MQYFKFTFSGKVPQDVKRYEVVQYITTRRNAVHNSAQYAVYGEMR